MENYAKKHDIFGELKQSNINFVSGKGAELYDDKGNTYITLNEMTTFLGQNHVNFTNKMTKALNELTISCGANQPYKDKLFKYLIESTDNVFEKILLTSSGSEATEWAVRIAKKLTGRCEVVSYWDSIHGRTYFSASMSGLPRRKIGHGTIASGIVHSIYPDCSNCEFNCKKETCNFYCLDFLDKKIEHESSRSIAAVIIEPYLGSKIIIPPKGYLKALRKWTEERGILLIIDEIQAGFGRTGELYSYKQEDIIPDMLLLGKGFGNGFNINAVLMREGLKKEDLSALYGGSADSELSCAASCAVYEELIDHKLVESVAAVGKNISDSLISLKQKCSHIKEIRCKGLAIAIEFTTKESASIARNYLDEKRFLIGGANTLIILKPPLTLTLEQSNLFIKSLEESLSLI